ncbi:type-1 restriction enzyme EcoKI specificity protein [mine drainage metagenome]|uniref:Type-1 restriction enzyme EcoKI specificity protein n=1 Tax=mine drainage metagenome TaxID=410659 RepID=A0A1J5TT67_9ZZZZ
MKAGWQIKTIGEVCEIVNGGTPKTGTKEYWGGPHQWITPAEMGKRSSPYIGETERTVTDAGLQNSSARMLPPYSVILSSRAPIGHLVINTEPMATNQGCKGLVPSEQIHYKFLYHYLSSIVGLLNDLGSGATFKELSGGKLKEVGIPVPPLPEQQRIVRILDEAFDGIATAKANAEQNLQNARALFESHLQSVFTQRGEGWEMRQLISLCSIFADSAHRTPKYQNEGIPALRPRDVINGKLNLSTAARVSEQEYEIQSKRYKPKAGDIVYSRELSFGWAALLPESPRVCLSQGMCIFRPSPDVDSTYLLYVLNGSIGREQAARVAVGAAHPHINLGDIKSYLIPLPPLNVQKNIVQQLDLLREETQPLESLYQRKLGALDELKKSLLHQAFSGAL